MRSELAVDDIERIAVAVKQALAAGARVTIDICGVHGLAETGIEIAQRALAAEYLKRAEDAEVRLARIAGVVEAHDNGGDGELTPGQSRAIALDSIRTILKGAA